MTERQIAACVLVAIVVASRIFYDHRNRRYARGKHNRAASPAVFEHVYAWVRWSTLVVGLGAFLSDHRAWLVVHDAPALVTAGMTVALLGFFLFAWAKTSLGRHYSPCYDVWVPQSIVERGPYARIRHPIYTANLLLLAGLATASGSLWLALNVVVVAGFYVPSALREERTLLAEHPRYASYMERTGRFMPRRRTQIFNLPPDPPTCGP